MQIPLAISLVFPLPLKLRVVLIRKKFKFSIFSKMALTREKAKELAKQIKLKGRKELWPSSG